MKRKIAIFTGNRAEYGLQFPVIQAVSRHPDLDYFLLVSGAHLERDFGRTIREINDDGFRIHREVSLEFARDSLYGFPIYRELNLECDQDSLYGTVRAIASGILNLSVILDELRPDIVLVYADRFEGFSAVITATQMGIPTGHLEGGDITQGGALDDSVRHAMSKLAHLHFTTNEEAAQRLRNMGEEPWRVHNVGFPAIDLIAEGNFADPRTLAAKYGIDPSRPLVIFTQHSVTTQSEEGVAQVMPSLAALETLARDGVQVVLTYPNNDAGGKRIIAELEGIASKKIPGMILHRSLGRYDYHGMLAICGRTGRGVCVGNSSSGIKETPALGCPAVNIGTRQDGRLRSTNVIDTGYDQAAILAAIRKCLFDETFRAACLSCDNPYGKGNAGRRTAEILATVELGSKILTKKVTV
ncbi:MAG: UDP-N-acetylglucosamine 2-epimerase [Candidatus Hydrogenedentota bacterium]